MNQKEKILESWIMVEHLSEGDINLRDTKLLTFQYLKNDDFYDLFNKRIKYLNLKPYQKGGIVVYFDIFKFTEVIDFLRDKFNLPVSNQEITLGNKFSFALYFDKDLKLSSDMTFLTESSYIRNFHTIPSEKEFKEFEEDFSKKIQEIFDCPEDKPYKEWFNKAILNILQTNKIDINNCRMKPLKNLETDATNLHSFFVNDLQKAKSVQSKNLNDYLTGNNSNRKDLDSRSTSPKFNRHIFVDILQPKNYPLSRFPSNIQFAPSFMQQVAINLSIGYDSNNMRSVNGPPGTGKTTLLKDIFSELLLKQSYEIIQLKNKKIAGNDETVYWESGSYKASIGVLPSQIAENGIIVASSNNGAVKNIVDELPLISEIDESLAKDLKEIDYFKDISNSKVSTKWVKENGKNIEKLESEKNSEEKFWGLFSLEGGRKENMDYIITALKHVIEDLKTNYISDDDVYNEFEKKYKEALSYRDKRQKLSDKIFSVDRFEYELISKKSDFNKNVEFRKNELSSFVKEINVKLKKLSSNKNQLGQKVDELNKASSNISEDKKMIENSIDVLKLQKPGLFQFSRKKSYDEQMRKYSDELLQILDKERTTKSMLDDFTQELKAIESQISYGNKLVEYKKSQIVQATQSDDYEIKKLEAKIRDLKDVSVNTDVNVLDFSLSYDDLQMSNPWFDEEYRRIQSELFISALKVRKQFLYENIKNIEVATRIWSKQQNYLDKNIVIQQAWNWINMVVPVISSTFASMGRMFSNIQANSLGHLFIDEAGQALPQASVGAIFRCKHVMAVGDPAQIKPVLTLDSYILSLLGRNYGVGEAYLSEDASTQTLIDSVSQYGFYKDLNNPEDWIGIPLWVHRRCKYPMFNISNEISYGGNMVQGNKSDGKAEWYDVGGSADNKYVKEQGDLLVQKIRELSEHNEDILDKSKKDQVYVISPFKNVAYNLSRKLAVDLDFTRYDSKFSPTNVGTVHTFQGKEAPIVFLVLGADEKSKGAANWAMGSENPNIMNVSATRAKKEFYIIGDKKLYSNLGSDVIDKTINEIRKFNSKEIQ
ncbi:MAG: AAA domain-containing protein [Finegoldia magna]|uniref:AAA domain-containing protein n=1 Tax=Finegoldia magna TaxID=1260 RepID=UPI002913CAE3|nr:AAA domain-containing protein [Finegoldia magna]MDU5369176.1 AAA domain-containing protein [Finegoldia magna]MDU5443413.1 AAA domain-containing protein [Finegoldia magna]